MGQQSTNPTSDTKIGHFPMRSSLGREPGVKNASPINKTPSLSPVPVLSGVVAMSLSETSRDGGISARRGRLPDCRCSLKRPQHEQRARKRNDRHICCPHNNCSLPNTADEGFVSHQHLRKNAAFQKRNYRNEWFPNLTCGSCLAFKVGPRNGAETQNP
jgi:hypothetical protein